MQDNLILLPHDPSLLIHDLPQKIHYLTIMSSLLKHFLSAIYDFQNQQLAQFDAQVGDTLCQIRAYKIHCLTTLNSEQILIEINQLKTNLKHAMANISKYLFECEQFVTTPKNQRPEWALTSVTLKDLFIQIEAIIPISDNALFLGLSHILCHFHKVDEEQIPVSINIKKIVTEWYISQGYAKKLTHYYQKILANASCSFIFEILSELPKLNHLKTLLPLLHLQGDEGRMVLPCHAVTEIIIRHMIQCEARVALIMKIQAPKQQRTMIFHLQGNPNLNEFVIDSDETIPNDTPCMVFYGTASHNQLPSAQTIRTQITEIGLSHIILTNNAAHPQYSGSALLAFRDNPYAALLNETTEYSAFEYSLAQQLSDKLRNLQEKANALGLTQDNSSMYFLKHIFCSTTNEYSVGNPKECHQPATVIPLRSYIPIAIESQTLRKA